MPVCIPFTPFSKGGKRDANRHFKQYEGSSIYLNNPFLRYVSTFRLQWHGFLKNFGTKKWMGFHPPSPQVVLSWQKGPVPLGLSEILNTVVGIDSATGKVAFAFDSVVLYIEMI